MSGMDMIMGRQGDSMMGDVLDPAFIIDSSFGSMTIATSSIK